MKIDAAWKNAKNILCVRLDAMGDVLMTTPAIRALKETLSARITLLTSSAGAQAARLVPEIDETLIFAAPWMKSRSKEITPQKSREMMRFLAARHFDAAVIFTVFSQNPLPAACLCYWADIPLRLAHCRENPYQLLTHWIRDPEPTRGVRHEVTRQLTLVSTIGCTTTHLQLSLHFGDDAKKNARVLSAERGVDFSRPRILFHPGATAPSRRYPDAHFADVANALALQGHQIIWVGSAEEAETIDGIQARMQTPSISLAGLFNLEELAAIIADAALLISNNSGPMHLACAVGTPVVAAYALTNPQHTPWGVRSRVLFQDVPCKFCYQSVCPESHHRCLNLLRPEKVVEAAQTLLNRKPADSREFFAASVLS